MNCCHFVNIPKNENDPRYPPEILNLCAVQVVQVFSEDKVMVYFVDGKTRTYHDKRAISLMQSIANL